MSDSKNDTQSEITIKPWIKRGMMLVNASALDWDDPDHIYNQIAAQGANPEDYGYSSPLEEEFKGWTRSQLMIEIMNLRKNIEAIYRHGMENSLRK